MESLQFPYLSIKYEEVSLLGEDLPKRHCTGKVVIGLGLVRVKLFKDELVDVSKQNQTSKEIVFIWAIRVPLGEGYCLRFI